MIDCPIIEFLGGYLLCPLGQVFQIEEVPSESWNPDVPSTLGPKRSSKRDQGDLESWNPDWPRLTRISIREDDKMEI